MSDTRVCANCQAVASKNAPRCKQCQQLFVGRRDRLRGQPVGKPGRKAGISPGRKAAPFDADAARASERALLALVDSPAVASSVPDFYVTTEGGGLHLRWPAPDLRLDLTPEEAEIVRRALA